MTISSANPQTDSIYPTGNGKPVAETFDHLYALLITLEVLRQYLVGQQATVLGNQYLYYAQGFPRLRTAPDVMVIFNVEPGGRDSYKVWEEGEVPAVIFEITSEGTKDKDEGFKKALYAQLGVQEYWQFDPKGEWITEQLRGYRWREIVNLEGEMEQTYEPITDGQSQPLKLRLVVEGKLIGFYRLDNGEKLLVPSELAEARRQAEQRASDLEAQLARYREQFGELPEG